jgi:hypothetical protein
LSMQGGGTTASNSDETSISIIAIIHFMTLSPYQ